MMSEMQQRPSLKSQPIRQHSFQDPDDEDQRNVDDIEQRIFLARRASEPPDARKAVMGEFAT